MRYLLDKSMIRGGLVDSGSLSTLSSVVHRIEGQGEYRGTVYRGTVKVGTFSLSVSDSPETQKADAAIPRQVSIDLIDFDNTAGAKAKDAPRTLTLRTGGIVLFFVSRGSGEYAVELSRRETKKESVTVFDSRLLSKGDVFITHVMRPGRYAVRDSRGKGTAELTVEYPEVGKLTRKMEPVMVEYKEGKMSPGTVKIQSVQAVMFSCMQESRILIELKKAEDRPRPVRAPRVAPAIIQKKEKTGALEEKKIIRKIRFSG